MDATSRRMLALMSEMNVRFVVPVYQRPYSWDVEQCARLLEDVRSCGRRPGDMHFTGSIVTILDGATSPDGVTSLLVIDGQQRITTVSLLLVALARFAQAHPNAVRHYSFEEIACGGYLTNHYRAGEQRYKLALSKGDQQAFYQLVDGLLAGSVPVEVASRHIRENLAFFEEQLREQWDADLVWRGLQQLEVVSIALLQGQDKPQVIFESMNSTGKDLSSADLIRNFVLMSYPIEEQDEVYRVYWQPIERTLGAQVYDGVFDDFIRCYLTVSQPLSLGNDGDAYQAFKRYVITREYRREDRMRILVLRLSRFAGYYVAATTGAIDDRELREALSRIERLMQPAVNPLLLALFDCFEHASLDREGFLEALGLLESYLFRRLICACDQTTLPKLVASLIARIQAAAAESAPVGQTLEVALLNEAVGATRFPGDAEFSQALAALAEHRRVLAESDEHDAVDAGFDPLLLAQDDERLAAGDDFVSAAVALWSRPEVDEETLAVYRSSEQARALAESEGTDATITMGW